MNGWRSTLPAALLLAVASTQMLLARTEALSAWKGGGFGMFASLDEARFRHVRVFVDAPGRSEEADIGGSIADVAERAATLPSRTWLERTVGAIVARERRHERPVSRVRVEVWRDSFHPVSLRATRERLRTLTMDVD